jgi:hypothetical protein
MKSTSIRPSPKQPRKCPVCKCLTCACYSVTEDRCMYEFKRDLRRGLIKDMGDILPFFQSRGWL